MKKAKKTAQYFFLILFSFFSIFPLYYVLCRASGGNTDITKGLILPGFKLLDNISYIVFETNFMASFLYTLGYTLLQTFFTLCVCSFAGYGFEIYHDRFKDCLFKAVLLTFMLPFTSLVVPLFILFSSTHMINTTPAMLLPFIASPLIIMIFRQQSRAFPKELVEAARLDGLREFLIFFRIYIPNMKSTFVCGTVIAFLHAWNSYQWPRIIMIHKEKVPMTVYLTLADKGNPMTLVLLSMLPTLILFFALQKFFIRGMQGALQ